MSITVKRVYKKPAPADGTRILVDRLWPCGLSKSSAAIDHWLRDLAPSDELRTWFHSNPGAWVAFRKRYFKELAREAAASNLEQLHQLAEKRNVTLVFASRNETHNNAIVLKEFLEGMRKPPTGTGPAAAKGTGPRQAARRPR
ncbi:MAG TPA: DUF488 family protein [Terriglobales bacterium]|nr:DUF488 family protein [Terriglobales bacterium]